MSDRNVIYNREDNANSAFMLRKGEIICEVVPECKFIVTGGDKIFGASEILISNKYNFTETRHFTVREGNDCTFSVIPKNNLVQHISDYNIGWNIGQHIAEITTELHKIVISLEKEMKDSEKESKKLLALYAIIVNIYKEEDKKRNLNWLRNFVKELINNPLYNKGIQYIKTSSKVEIDETSTLLVNFKKKFKHGDIICKKGDTAEDLYILTEGNLRVELDENTVIDVISDRGTVIGEMAILLEGKRTADLIAVDDVTLIAMGKDDIKNLFKSESDIFINTITNLAMREAYNCNYIKKLYELTNQEPEERSKSIDLQNKEYRKQLKLLMERISELTKSYHHYIWLEYLNQKAEEKYKSLDL